MEINKLTRVGTCSWNYESWIGLVYSEKKATAAEYLIEYSKKYNSVEIDSWFYKVPDAFEVDSYISSVPSDFMFSIKAPQKITQVFKYGKTGRNKDFLSVDLYSSFYRRIEPIKANVDCIMFEFEYMNKEKMSGLDEYIKKMTNFIVEIPREIPIAVECRNKNYLVPEYFDFLYEHNVSVVLSEKQYQPPITSLIEKYSDKFNDKVVVRLLGGDRKEIEEKTKEKWNTIVEPKDIHSIAGKLGYLVNIGKNITINVNNHYEGSAPITIDRLIKEMQSL